MIVKLFLLHREKKDSEREARKADTPLWLLWGGGQNERQKKSEDLFRYNPSPGRIQNRELLERKAGGGLDKERAKFWARRQYDSWIFSIRKRQPADSHYNRVGIGIYGVRGGSKIRRKHTDKKKKIKFPSYLRKFWRDRLQSHIWPTTSWNMVAHFLIQYIRRPFLIYDFATDPIWMFFFFFISADNFSANVSIEQRVQLSERYWIEYTAKTKYRNFETNIPRKGISGSQSQFPQSCVCEWFIYSHDWSAYSAGGNMYTDPGTI
jgi:hypothetical protein